MKMSQINFYRMTFLFFLIAGIVYPQTYYLNVWSKGKVTSIPVSEIKKVTFTNTTGIIETEKELGLPTSFSLYQNYPNPFNPTTQIEYSISGTGDVKVQVFNVNGELVKTLTNATQSAGKYKVTWNGIDSDGKQAASGVYIYRVMFGNSMLSKKMLLLK